EWDDRIAFISTTYAQELGIDTTRIKQINLKLRSGASRDLIQKQLSHRLQLPVLSWYDLNPAVVAALRLEALATCFILCLIILITSITTMSLLSMHLLYHQHTIALLYSFGTSKAQLTLSFMLMGILLACSSALVGIGAAAILSYIIDHYRLIALPAIYYSHYVPARMSFDLACGTFLITGLMTLCTTWYSARRIKTMPLAQIL